MKVRITSDNLLSNPLLELHDNATPTGWFTFVNGTAIKKEWVLEDTQTLHYPSNINYIDAQDDFFNFVEIVKGVSAKVSSGGSANFKNTPSQTNVLTERYRLYNDIDTEQPEIQDRYITVFNGQLFIRELLTTMRVETTMMRKPNFSDDPQRTLYVLKNTIGRELASVCNYTPLSTSLEFINCNGEIHALATFFKTAIKYKAGFTIEAFLKPTDEEGWGGDTKWGASFWGGLDPAGQWVKLYHLDANNYALNRASTTGSISVSAILQKNEVNNVYK